jgi:small subunit ribosomal protein S17
MAQKKAPETSNEGTSTADGAATDGARGRRIEVVGEVISNKMNKTISVLIYRLVRHKKYGKFMRRTSVFKAHDEKNVAKIGDTVRLYHTRPLSKTKRWALAEVVQSGKQTGAIE